MPTTENLAAAYIRGKGTRPSSDDYGTFCRWVELRYQRIRHCVDFTPLEISPEKMMRYWQDHHRLLISTAHNFHPHWLPRTNAMFRAIHDWDHIHHGCGYDLDGEVSAYVAATETAPDTIRWILYSEIVLQAAAAIHTGSFQRQKLVRVDV